MSYFIILLLFIIIRFIIFKPHPHNENLRTTSVVRTDSNNKLQGYSTKDLENYPYGPFYLIWQHNQYNNNAALNKSPYYWEEQNFRMKDVLKTYILTDGNHNHYGFVNRFMTNVQASTDYTKMLLWATENDSIIHFCFVDLNKIKSLGNYSEFNLPDENKPWYFYPEAVTEFKIEIKKTILPYTIILPEEIAAYFPEIIIPLNIKDIYDNKSYNDTCLLIVNTKEKTVTIYPQDWFNSQHLDFGYQWIMTARRLTASNLITVAAMRTGYFILDESNRNLLKK